MVKIIMPTELERLANETLEQLCNDHPGDSSHRLTMKAAFEIFRNQIVFREANEMYLKERKQWYKVAYRWE